MKNIKIMMIVILVFCILVISGCELQLSQPKGNALISKSEATDTLEGRVSLIAIDDFDNPQNSRLEWFINTPQGSFILRGDNLFSLTPGSKIRVSGKLDGTDLTITDEIVILRDVELPGPEFNLGENKILIISGEYGDYPTNLDTEEIRHFTFEGFPSINGYYEENSYGKSWFEGDVIGPLYLGDIKPTGMPCWPLNHQNKITITEDFIEAVDSLINFTEYKRIIFLLGDNCANGFGEIGPAVHETSDGEVIQTWAWVSSYRVSDFIHIASHELGHNFGTLHSNFAYCGNIDFGDNFSNCESWEYGNIFSVMGGNSRLGHFTVNYKDQIGWINIDEKINVTSGKYFLTPLEIDNGLKEIMIPYGVINAPSFTSFLGNVSAYYIIEYRQPLGYDNNWNPDYNYSNYTYATPEINGTFVTFRTIPYDDLFFNPYFNSNEHLIDSTPEEWELNGTKMPQEDSMLLEGQEFHDNNIGITIRVLSMNSSGAEIEIIRTKVPSWTECNTETQPKNCNAVCTDLNTTCVEECTTISRVENAGAEIFIDVNDCSLDYSYESGCFNTIPTGSSRHCCCLIESVGEPEPPSGGGKEVYQQALLEEEGSQLSKESIFTKIINIIKNILTAKIK